MLLTSDARHSVSRQPSCATRQTKIMRDGQASFRPSVQRKEESNQPMEPPLSKTRTPPPYLPGPIITLKRRTKSLKDKFWYTEVMIVREAKQSKLLI